ncbi:MAG: ribosomal L7Ae/L30e/S12e/Gadd45 family protein [Lachnospiraceae bacterium]|nr:ribosomal L7Ae/L30e/S12e/Gadd45 family protein [Lachnospiraceae bacterium]
METKAFRYLGLAARAGCVPSGEFQTENAVRGGKAYVVIIAGDASQNTKKKFRNMCEYRNVPVFEFSDKATLGQRIGRGDRTSCAITDENLAGAFIKTMRDEVKGDKNGKNQGS